MIMQDNEKKPALRFKGFTDPWEQREFEEIAVRSSVMSDKKGLPRVEYEDIISGAGRLNKDIKLKESEKVGIVFHKGDVLYGKLRPYLQNWLLATFNGLAVGDFWVLQPQNTDSSFLYRLVQSQRFDGVANQSTGTKMPRADWKLVSKTKFAMPHSVDEQAAIGAYFEHLDTLITLHQRKYEKLVNIKKSMLDKMFPKNGASVPEIRFKGFTDLWEQRKLKELYFQLTERNTDLLPYQKTLSVATMSFKTDGNGAADTSLANYKRLRTGDIAFEGHTSKEFRYGRFVLNDVGDGIMSPRFSALRPLHEMPINFWKYYIHYEPIMRKVLVNSTKAGTMMNELVINDFLQGSILVPSMTEQQAIGRFFKQLDTLITLHQRKLEKLQNIKKSCLEKMFV